MINLKDKKILLTGGSGFIGKAVIENLCSTRGLKLNQIIIPRQPNDDLRSLANCERLLRENKINIIIHLAALVGGVGYSSRFPATQYYNNILMDLQIMEAAKNHKIEKIVMIGSACAYPRDAQYPLSESQLWSGLPQKTNLAYGIAKRILTIQADAYRQEHKMKIAILVPNNAYGPGDNFDPEYSHIIPSIIRKCVAGENPLIVWGDGTPTRDFFYVKDFAEGVILATEKLETDEYLNLGSGTETSIREVVNLIQELTNHQGKIQYDKTKPNGQERRSVNINKAKKILDFTPKYDLRTGLKETIEWYKKNKK